MASLRDVVFEAILNAVTGQSPQPSQQQQQVTAAQPVPVPVLPAVEPGIVKTAGGLAGTAVLPSDYRPAVAPPAPVYLPPMDGLYDPISGQTRLTPDQLRANLLALDDPSRTVVKKGDGRPTRTVTAASGSDPSIPKLTPLWSDDTATAIEVWVPAEPNGPGYMSGYVKDNNWRLLPSDPGLEITDPRAKPAVVVGVDVPPQPQPPIKRNQTVATTTRQQSSQPSKRTTTYAGVEQPPSLLPPADPGVVQGMAALQNPFVQFLSALGLGGGTRTSSGTRASGARGAGTNMLPAGEASSDTSSSSGSGSYSFDGKHFYSGGTPGAYYDFDTGSWQIQGYTDPDAAARARAPWSTS